VVGVSVAVRHDVRAGKPAAVDDRGVVERVARHDAVGRERRDHARVGQEAGAEQHAGVVAFELGELLLERVVNRHVSRHQARRAGTGTPA